MANNVFAWVAPTADDWPLKDGKLPPLLRDGRLMEWYGSMIEPHLKRNRPDGVMFQCLDGLRPYGEQSMVTYAPSQFIEYRKMVSRCRLWTPRVGVYVGPPGEWDCLSDATLYTAVWGALQHYIAAGFDILCIDGSGLSKPGDLTDRVVAMCMQWFKEVWVEGRPAIWAEHLRANPSLTLVPQNFHDKNIDPPSLLPLRQCRGEMFILHTGPDSTGAQERPYWLRGFSLMMPYWSDACNPAMWRKKVGT